MSHACWLYAVQHVTCTLAGPIEPRSIMIGRMSSLSKTKKYEVNLEYHIFHCPYCCAALCPGAAIASRVWPPERGPCRQLSAAIDCISHDLIQAWRSAPNLQRQSLWKGPPPASAVAHGSPLYVVPAGLQGVVGEEEVHLRMWIALTQR